MKTKLFTLLTAVAISAAATAQVLVQPVTGVHTVKVEDNVILKIYPGEKTQLEVGNNMAVAQISNGVMSMGGTTSAVLRLNPADRIINFTAEDDAQISFLSSFDFGDRQLVVTAEDDARVEFGKGDGTLTAGYIILRAQDNARILSDLPLRVNAYKFSAVDDARIEVASIDEKPVVDSTLDRTHEINIEDDGRVVIRNIGEAGVFSADQIPLPLYFKGNKAKALSREPELNWTWGFNHWLGDHPFSGRIGEPDGAAEVSYYFMNVGLSFDYPIVNTPHFGLYAGLGIEGNRYHFREHRVVATPTGFQAPSGTYPALADITSGNPDPNNWDSYFNTYTLTVPITFSFEPWNYDDLCIRLTALPGINVYGALLQDYQSKTAEVEVRDREVGNQVNDFSFDARLAVYYGNLGLYAQMSFCKLFDFGFYPVKFGLIWSLTAR